MKMKYLNIFLLAGAMAVMSCTKEVFNETVQPSAPSTMPEEAYLPGEVIVKFDASLSDLLDEAGLSKGPATRSGVSTVDELLAAIDGYQLERVFPEVKATSAQSREAGMHLWYVVHFSEDEDVNDVVAKLSALGEVSAAAPVLTIKKAYDGKVIPFDASKFGPATRAAGDKEGQAGLRWQWNLVNDPAETAKYRINPEFEGDHTGFPDYPYGGSTASEKFAPGYDIGMKTVWDEKKFYGDPSIVVAVLDEGLCLTHPDLRANLWVNEGEIYGSNEDNDGNGYAGDMYGYDFIHGKGTISWDSYGDTGHGTHCAGIIAAVNNNNEGINSIAGGTPDAPGVKIMSCQVFSGNEASNTVDLARAIKYAADNGAVVLQCSFGYTSGTANPYEYGTGFRTEEEWAEGSPLEKVALDYFIHNAGSENGPIKGGIAVFASGNEYAPSAGFPGAYEDCVSVAAVAGDFTPSTFTNYGDMTKISAPGGDQDYYYDYLEDGENETRGAVGCILSTVPTHVSASGYGYMEGTSMACPHVSGVAALGLSYAARLHKHFTADEFKELLYASCKYLTDDPDDQTNETILSGYKFYYKWHVDASQLIHGRRFQLSSYRNKMGAGVVNAANLLDLIEGNTAGTPMQFPNVYVQNASEVTYDPSAYLAGDSFSVTIDDPSIATVGEAGAESGSASVTGAKGQITFFAQKNGSTTATITPSGSGAGAAQTFTITVSLEESGSDWL